MNGPGTRILPIILNSFSVSSFLLNFGFLLSHTADFDESITLPFLLLVLTFCIKLFINRLKC